MMPFDSVQDGMDWIISRASGPVEVLVHSQKYIMAGARIGPDGPGSSWIQGEYRFW